MAEPALQQDGPADGLPERLRPYQVHHGQVLNPGGRNGRALEAYVRRETRDGVELVDMLLKVIRGEAGRRWQKPSEVKWACEQLLKRGWGQPKASVELTTPAGDTVDVMRRLSRLSSADLERLEAIMARLLPAGDPVEAAIDVTPTAPAVDCVSTASVEVTAAADESASSAAVVPTCADVPADADATTPDPDP